MKLLIMGLTASGKTSLAKALANVFSLRYLSGSDTLLQVMGAIVDRSAHFWLGEEGQRLDIVRDSDDYDVRADTYLMSEIMSTSHVATDSWTLPWLIQDESAIRVYLCPSLEARVAMAQQSRPSGLISDKDLSTFLVERDEKTRERFLRLYGFDVFDSSSFDVVFDNSTASPVETMTAVACRLKDFARLGDRW